MKIGFTGTQRGMPRTQASIIGSYFHHIELHHGDCIGADEQAHNLAKSNGSCRIVIHPPLNSYKRAWCPNADTVLSPLDYLDRNRAIVDRTDLLLAAPGEYEEQLRSGTWATIRYAKKQSKKVIIIYPDGTDWGN